MTMSKVASHLEVLLGQRGTQLWPGYVNMVKTLASVFQSPKHWVLEFLQNAEDARATRFTISLDSEELIVMNDGNSFDDEDFQALCDVNSRKLPSLGFRGYLGIGFKSIFTIASQVHIHSGEYHFMFSKNAWRERMLQEGRSLADHPWEILPVEIPAELIPDGHNTIFQIPLDNKEGTEILDELDQFFTGDDFPKEAILLLKNIESIDVNTRYGGLRLTKKIERTSEERYGVVEVVVVNMESRSGTIAQSHYIVVRKVVIVPSEIREDAATERLKRADVTEREIGLVFGIDTDGHPVKLEGKLGGVYSFLPVEGEQTGLPFGIFGDYIPQAGRDLINYGVRWNEWISEELGVLFLETMRVQTLSDQRWQGFSAEILNHLRTSSTNGPGEKFWKIHLRDPLKKFLETEPFYPDDSGSISTLESLVGVNQDVLDIIGSGQVEGALGKRVPHADVRSSLEYSIEQLDIRMVLADTSIPERLKSRPEKLAELYALLHKLSPYMLGDRRGRDVPLDQRPFVLGEDGILHKPSEVIQLELDLELMPGFLTAIVPEDKTTLHPTIAANSDAVEQLRRCGMEKLDKGGILSLVGQKLNSIRSPQDAPGTWAFPDDLVAATHFLISAGADGIQHLNMLLTNMESFEITKNLFVPSAPLDWGPLYEANLIPGWGPVNSMYLQTEKLQQFQLEREKVLLYFEGLGVHGFKPADDRQITDTAAMTKARQELQKDGHVLEDVTRHRELGYALECKGHCISVFEVKGMGHPRDEELPESETRAAQQHGSEFHLVFVYNLPNDSSKVGYKLVKDPYGRRMLEAVEKSRIRSASWLNI